MVENLDNKQLVDINHLLDFLSENGFDIYDSCISRYEMSLKEAFDEYKKSVMPNIEIGQAVWIVEKWRDDYKVRYCTVHKMQVKKRRTFSVRNGYYCGTFTKNSIGKTVFFSKEDAIKSLNGKEYEVID